MVYLYMTWVKRSFQSISTYSMKGEINFMITRAILQSVYRIRIGLIAGSSFTIVHKEIQYIITAKHLFENACFPNEATIEILHDGKYESLHVLIYYSCDSDVDIAVLKTNPYYEILPKFENPTTSDRLTIGQDVYFLGFPYDYESLIIDFPDEKTPVPFVKKACASGFGRDKKLMYLDGMNNPGFSGGPVCFRELTKSPFKIAGVISGYRFDKKKVFYGDENETSLTIRENTGIINAFDIRFAIAIINNIIS